ncbi:hypothetical protein [Pseudomonas sp. Gutcm_11s]|uniref:hypothetical protein n=1 Tax=Pseudomonas sp. Gutcm_11s TaxID=3026088 RepID=UPI00235E7EAF|nr:hypothetical protein [Pseudomonas sp. Gutcm_11s]MDD0844932.1 hypothetical protein [Pseudomonas sp. Gutcm_11s]
MNTKTHRISAAVVLCLLMGQAHAEFWTVDALVNEFNQISAQIGRGELDAAERALQNVSQHTAGTDTRVGQYQRELAKAYLQRGKQQLQAGDASAAEATLGKGQATLVAASPELKQQYLASLNAARANTEAVVQREAEAAKARQDAETARQRQLAEQKAAAEREARARQAQAQVQAEQPKPAPVAQAAPAKPRAQLIDPSAASSSVPLPMLDANDRNALRDLLDKVAADVVAFDCAVRLEVREAKDYPFVAALLSARIKKLDPGFAPQLSPLLKPDQEPRLVLSPQSNG